MCIIDKALWDLANIIKSQKSQINSSKHFSTPFLLQGKLKCSCGQEIKPKNYGSGKTSVYRCTPELKNKEKSHMIIPSSLLEKKVISKLLSLITVENINQLWELYEQNKQCKINELKASIDGYFDKIDSLDEKLIQIKDALDLNFDQSIKLEVKQLLTIIEKEISHYEDTIEDKQKQLQGFHQDLQGFIKAFDDLFNNLNTLDVYNKRMIIHSLVDSILITKVDPSPTSQILIDITLNPNSDLFMTTS
ncbi:zinc ribbon domain-containing protein [Alkaliphilus hydrothermalis]|uniref:Transcriptional regulator n=1 Tax=Alkaliphilus hydrothermalis TaxID=1482730 RepID=A0ABS2NTP8_9FIRM|nr:zinc ribbon domain-containing protein [Alkaliphilus hydrothermalis]MBM7616306.1 putative transcriptional regulator [Alkaliphilus hydrothermalis]